MNSQFQLSCLCGKCFRPVSSSTGGFILSCTDLLCIQCSNNGNITSCPACGKQNIQALSLKEPLPDEVSASISDPVIKLESVINTTKFQIKYYKQTLKKLLSTVSQLAKENQQLKSIISQQRNGADTSINSAGSSFFQEPQKVAPRASMNQLLSSPVDLASMPPAVSSVATLRPQTSLSVQATGSLLAKRPNTSLRHMNDTTEGPPLTQSPHFTTNPGSWKRSATSDCPFSAMPAATDSAVSNSSARPAQQSGPDTAQWGFGLPAEHAGGTIPVRSPSSYGPAGSSQARNAVYSHMGGGSSERPYTARKPPTPTSIARPFSAVPRSPPPFVTPSRLRSPHLSVARGAQSGGSSARSTAAAMETSRTAAANPWQGRSVTLSQSGNASSEYDKTVQLQQQQMSQSSSSGGNHLDNFVRTSTRGIH